MVTKQIKQKQADGTVLTLDIGVDAANVTTDDEHQFVSGDEKTAWGHKPSAVSVTVPASGWGSDNTDGYPVYYDIEVLGVTEKDRASVTIAVGSLAAARACGMCPTNETLESKIRIRARQAPAEEITAQYWIEKGKE